MPNNPKQTTRIYTGPAMIANGLIARLNDIGISPSEEMIIKAASLAGSHKEFQGRYSFLLETRKKRSHKQLLTLI